MKLPKDEFRKLQQHWYSRLAEAGFDDIEKLHGDRLVLKQSSTAYSRNCIKFSTEMMEEYFRCLAQAVNDEFVEFNSATDEYILVRRSEGAQIKSIVKELEDRGDPLSRRSVRLTIQKYEMAWGLRTEKKKA